MPSPDKYNSYVHHTRGGDIGPGVRASFGAQGIITRSDLAALSQVSREIGFPVVITQASCATLRGRPHHKKRGTYDVRTIGLSELDRLVLRDALVAHGFKVYYHEPGNIENVAPHYHITRPGGRVCDRHAGGGVGLLAKHNALSWRDDMEVKKREAGGELTLSDYAAFVAMGAGAAAISTAITWAVRKAYRAVSNRK